MPKTGLSEGRLARRERSLALRISGMRYRAIGEALGVNYRQAHRDVQAALAEIAKHTHERAETLRTIELARCERLTLALEPKIEAGDAQAVRALIAVMERRAKLLGLDAPVQVGVSDGAGGPVTVVHQHIGPGAPLPDILTTVVAQPALLEPNT